MTGEQMVQSGGQGHDLTRDNGQSVIGQFLSRCMSAPGVINSAGSLSISFWLTALSAEPFVICSKRIETGNGEKSILWSVPDSLFLDFIDSRFI